MKKVAIYGAGGFGKEVRMLIDIIASRKGDISFSGFIDDFVKPELLAITGIYNDIAIAIADPAIREKLYQRLQKDFSFSSIIHPDVYIDASNTLDQGIIICGGVYLTVDITLGKFVIINLGATIGHDVTIGNFTSIMPSVNISGSVTIGKNVFIGSGATILQGLSIGDGAVIGAGAVVTKSIPAGITVVGVPARELIRR